MSWSPVLDEDTSQRADGEQWRASYTDATFGTVYVEATKVGGCVWIAPLGSDWTGTESLEWVRATTIDQQMSEDTRCDVWEPEDGPLAGPPNAQCLLAAGHPGGHLFDPWWDR